MGVVCGVCSGGYHISIDHSSPLAQSSFSKQFGHFYDLSKHMDKGRLEEAKTTYFPSQWKGNSLRLVASAALQYEPVCVGVCMSCECWYVTVGVSAGVSLWVSSGVSLWV